MRISPYHVTTLVFNVPLQHGSVELEGRGYFRSVLVDEATGVVTLLASDLLPRDRPLLLTVRFADGDLPRSIAFRLVMHPVRSERQVQVYRRPRDAESYQQEARQEHERTRQCEARLEQIRVEQKHFDGLLGLIEAGLVEQDKGVYAWDMSKSITQHPDETLTPREAYGYRTMGRVAVALRVQNTGTRPWTVAGAELKGTTGARPRVLRVWPLVPIAPDDRLRIVVEAETLETHGTFILKLWEANGPRTLTLRGVTFQ